MKVRELIEELQKVDPERAVILQKDAEGNSYSPLADTDDNAVYQAESGEARVQALTDALRAQGFTESDVGEGEPCLVLVPVD